jgi:[acyl-carrier-protein] S-malonyltransferase
MFPGQGSQKAGMGREVFEASAAARAVFELADEVLGRPLTRLCFEGPDDELTRTSSAQPAILATSLAILAETLQSGGLSARPAYCAGHSLGQFTALVAAGALQYEDALKLVQERGRLMEEAGRQRPGTLAAIVALDAAAVEAICQESGAEPCNYNGPTQIVVGGTSDAVERACELAKERGGRGLAVNVSGAFHTSLMAPAAEAFAGVLKGVDLREPLIPVVSNVTARPLNGADIRGDLERQITSPVRWHQSIVFMVEQGVSSFVEIGPGRILSTQLKRSLPEARVTSINGASTLAGAANV